MNKTTDGQVRIHRILELIFEINTTGDYIAFFEYDGDSCSVSFSIYERFEDDTLPPFPEASMCGIGIDGHYTFDEAEDFLSEFLSKERGI